MKIFIICLLMSFSVFAEPHMKRVKKEEGQGKFITGIDGRQYCTHEKTTLAFTLPRISIGLDVVNKNTGKSAHYYYTGQYTEGTFKINLFKKMEGDKDFSKYIGMNDSTYYFEDLAQLDNAEVDQGFRYTSIANVNTGTSTLYCTKK